MHEISGELFDRFSQEYAFRIFECAVFVTRIQGFGIRWRDACGRLEREGAKLTAARWAETCGFQMCFMDVNGC